MANSPPTDEPVSREAVEKHCICDPVTLAFGDSHPDCPVHPTDEGEEPPYYGTEDHPVDVSARGREALGWLWSMKFVDEEKVTVSQHTLAALREAILAYSDAIQRLATHGRIDFVLPPATFEAMMRSIGPVPPEMYSDLQEVWEFHHSDLRRLSDAPSGEGERDG